MNREEAKHFSEVLKAYSEGKEIEVKSGNGEWGYPLTDELWFTGNPMCYRIKPEPKYRPYANAEEFLQEYEEHGPFMTVEKEEYITAISVRNTYIIANCIDGVQKISYFDLVELGYQWRDTTPCGIAEE